MGTHRYPLRSGNPDTARVLISCAGVWMLMAGSLFIACAAHADESGWNLVRSKAGVEVTQRATADSPFKITRGVMISDAGMFAVLAVLGDVEACQEWLHRCRRGRRIEERAHGDHIYHTVIDSPFLLKDRETYVRSIVSYRADPPSLRIDMTDVEEARPLHDERVRVLDFKGYWLIERYTDDQIRLTYQVYMDPQVSTASAANSTLATSVLETLRKVDRLARSSAYRDALPPEGLPGAADTAARP